MRLLVGLLQYSTYHVKHQKQMMGNSKFYLFQIEEIGSFSLIVVATLLSSGHTRNNNKMFF